MSEYSKKRQLTLPYDSDLFPYNSKIIPEKHKSFAQKDDKEVWKMFKNGDDDAFSYLYIKYAHLLFRFGFQYIKERKYSRTAYRIYLYR